MSDIHDIAILTKFSGGSSRIAKRDKESTEEFTESHGASEDSASVIGKLFPPSACGDGDKNPILACRNFITKARRWHYEHSLTYEEGWQIMAAATLPEHEAYINTARFGLEECKRTLLYGYDELVRQARIARNGLFKVEDYPTAEDFVAGFEIRVEYRPLPDARILPGRLGEALKGKLREQIEADNERRIQRTVSETYRRLLLPVIDLAGRLADPTRRKLSSIIGAVREVAEMVPNLNLTGDPQLSAAAGEIQRILSGITVDALNESQIARMETATALVAVAQQFGKLGNRKL